MSTQLDSEIRARIESFVEDLTDLIRLSALESVQAALGSTGTAARAPGRKKKGRKKGKKASRKGARRVRRSSADVDALGSTVLSHVRSNPGLRLEEISADLGTPSGALKRPIAILLEEGALRTEGKARGTKYFVGSGRPRKKASKKKGTKGRRKKKASRKGARKKKRARKTTARKTKGPAI